MRILHLYKDYFPVIGGIENHIRLLAEAQAAQGHEVGVLVTAPRGPTTVETIHGVRVMRAKRLATVSSAPLSLDLARLLARERPDITHLHFPYPPGELTEYLFGRGRRTVLTYHSDIVRQRYLRVAYAPFLQRVLARAHAIIAESPNYLATSPILARWKDKCTIVPLGIDPSPFLAADIQRGDDSSHSRAGASLLFVGRLRYYKGLGYLLAALPGVPEARLTVVGTGPMEQSWKRLAREFGVESRVEFVGDIPESQLPACYAACDIFVLPASERSEAFGLVQLEAMASARPVISTVVGTGVEWVNQDQVTGLVVPARNAGALAGALRQLLADPARRQRMGAAGRARVLEKFTVQAMAEGVMEVYQQVLLLFASS